jgi:hypothetical protein
VRKEGYVAHAAFYDDFSASSNTYPHYARCLATAGVNDIRSKLTADAPGGVHRDQLPPEPKNYHQMLRSAHKKEWIDATHTEIEGLRRKNAFIGSSKKLAQSLHKSIIPLTWVFKYKFDSDGYLTKYKARLCARGDLQSQWGDTYAATLASRIFRAMMAIAGAFDLEMRSYDALNAFLNAKLQDKVFCETPEGFPELGECIELLRALYGLKEAPLLWYRELTKSLSELGLHPVPDAPCLYRNDFILVFFYVDDIVVLSKKQHLDKLHDFESKLFKKYEIRSLGELRWFLGVRIMRDRPNKKIWLLMDSYIQKVITKYNLTPRNGKYPNTPMSTDELLPSTEIEDPIRTKLYQ